jgi:hypothetical protein
MLLSAWGAAPNVIGAERTDHHGTEEVRIVFNTEKFKRIAFVVGLALVLMGVSSANAADTDDADPFLAGLKEVANPSTVPANGDENPYGVVFVSHGAGLLKTGSILVSNFNNGMNSQGTGTTIVQIGKRDNQSLFFQGKMGLGLTTALGVLPGNLVIVGNVPTTDGTSATVMQGSLLIVSSKGGLVDTLTSSSLLDGPWDLTVQSNGNSALVFVSNVLSGTVTRLNISVKRGTPTVTGMMQIASGYLHRTDPNALVVGPTGLVFDSSKDLLYVASTGDNEIFSIANAGTTTTDNGMGTLVYSDRAHLHGPLALAMAPNGNLLTSNGDAVNPDPTHNSEIVEFTPSGSFVDELQVDTAVGAAFGIAVSNGELAAVDDNTNTLRIYVDSDTDMGGGNSGMGMNGM